MEYANYFLELSQTLYESPLLTLGVCVVSIIAVVFFKTIIRIVLRLWWLLIIIAIGVWGYVWAVNNHLFVSPSDEWTFDVNSLSSYGEAHIPATGERVYQANNSRAPQLTTQDLNSGIAIIRNQFAHTASHEAAWVYTYSRANGIKWYGPTVSGGIQINLSDLLTEAIADSQDYGTEFVLIHNHPGEFFVNQAPPSVLDIITMNVIANVFNGINEDQFDRDKFRSLVVTPRGLWSMRWKSNSTIMKFAKGQLTRESKKVLRLNTQLQQISSTIMSSMESQYACGTGGYDVCDRTSSTIRQADQAVKKLLRLYRKVGVVVDFSKW